MKIYTKQGDKGKTQLLGGSVVKKNHLKLECYGTVDELNALIGNIYDQNISPEHKKTLLTIQNQLFNLGSRLAFDGKREKMNVPNITENNISNLEKNIDELLNKLKVALVPFLEKANYNLKLNIESNFEDYTSLDDKWKNWVFELSGSYNNDKEESRKTNRYEVEFEIDKLTEDWRIGMEIKRNESNRKFYSDDNEYTSNRKTTSFRGRVVRSISDHFSAGVFFGAYQNTYENIDFNRYLAPAIEYSLYPYKDVLSKEITLAYRIGTGKRNYIEETIYGYTEQKLTSQTLSLNIRFRQKWGNISSYINGTQFLNDGTKKRFSLRSDLDIRVFEGLAVRLSGNINLIREQYSLAAGNTSVEDLLLQQRQIATDYRTNFSIGLSYTFGSIYNSIINTRL